MINDILLDETPPAESSRHVASVSAALTILRCFRGDEELSLAEIHRRTGIAKSRILRLAGTMEVHGFLWKEPGRKTYCLGPNLLQLAQGVGNRYRDIAQVLRPLLSKLAADSGDTALYSVVQAGNRLCVASEEPDIAVRFSIPAGMFRPLYAGASGKVLLAFGPETRVREVLNKTDWRKLTDRTPCDPQKLEDEIAQIRRDGFAVSLGEAQPDSFAIAVPVLDEGKRMLGALSVAGPASRISPERTGQLVTILRGAAPAVSRAVRFLPLPTNEETTFNEQGDSDAGRAAIPL